MSPDIGIILAVLLLVIILPLALSAQQYFRDKTFAKPVVQFSYKWWRNIGFLWTLFQTSFGLALLFAAGYITVKLGPDPFAFIADAILLLVAWRQFPAIRLYWTYWQWDGQARLSFNRAEKTATYVNREISLTFAVSEIERLSHYEPPTSRAASADYSYATLHLTNARELVITSLVCNTIEWLTILPAVRTEFIKQRFAWLPTDSKSKKFFSPFSK